MPPAPPPRTYRVKSFGCQMNVYDGERMAELLGQQGIAPAPDGEEADLVVLNTCHIRERAAEKVYSDIGRIAKNWDRGDGTAPLIAVAGCVAQAEGEEIMRRAPSVSMVVGPQAYHRLPAMLAEAVQGKRLVDTDMPAETKFDVLPGAAQGRAKRVSDRPGRLRQVLHLLRGALHPGRGSFAIFQLIGR